MSRGFQGVMLRALGANEHLIRVDEVWEVVPGLRRVRFTSETVFDDFTPGPTDYLRLWFPDPDDPSREVQRGYTVLAPDAAAGTFVIDFVIHEPVGPASGWATTCAPGDNVTATVYGTNPYTVGSPEPAGELLIGDAASIPAINSMLEVIPDHMPVEVLLEWGDERELAIPLTEHLNSRVRRFRRDGTGQQLVGALAGQDWTGWHAWVASERTTMKAVRAALRDVHGFPKSDHKAQTYWIHGRSMGTSRGGSVKAAAKASAETAAAAHPLDGESSVAPAAETRAVTVPDGWAPGTIAAGADQWRSQAGAEVLRPLRGTLRIAGAAQAVLTVAGLVPYLILAEVGRHLLAGEPVSDQWPLAQVALAVLAFTTVLGAVLVLWLHHVDARFALELRRRLVAKLARLPLGWFTERNSATVKQVVTDDTNRLHYYVSHAAVDVAGAIVAPVAVLVYLFTVDARLAAVLLVPVIAYAFVFASMMQASRSKIDEFAEWGRRLDGETIGYLDGLPVVRTFGGSAGSRLRRSVGDFVKFLGDWQRPFVGRKATANLITDAMTFLTIIIVVGGWLVTSGRMSATDLLPFLLLGTTFGTRLLALAYNAGGLREARAAAQRIGIALTEPDLAAASASASDGAGAPVAGAAGLVRLDGVTFGYRRGEPVLHGVDLTLRPGTVTALVGPSGSGKSTLASLVARFHDPTEGTITIDGIDLRSLSSDDLYQRVGFVLQDLQVVRASLHDNIALARPGADRTEVLAAAHHAVLDDLIGHLPRGLDTVIGEDAELSGGEAQRVAIARAILADTPVVVLDEATAFADPDSEHQVQTALSRLLADRTVLVIAHRLHTIVDANTIVVLDRGRVVQHGTHADLVATDGRYRELWQHAQSEVHS